MSDSNPNGSAVKAPEEISQIDESLLFKMRRKGDTASRSAWRFRVSYFGLLGVLLFFALGPFKPMVIGVASILLMLLLIFSRVHVGIAMVGPGVLGLLSIYGPAPALTMLKKAPYEVVASWEYSVIPMFVLMGLLLWRSGATESLYGISKRYLRWLPGGLAVGTTVAGAGLAATSGSTIGTVYALGRIGMPEMLKAGYDARLASGTVLMAGLIGQVIPPSVFLVIYAGVAEAPVGPQLLAGVMPGLVMTGLFCITVVTLAIVRPSLAGRGDKRQNITKEEEASLRSHRLRDAWPIAIVITVVIGGIYTGIVTATEAGALAALLALGITFVLLRPGRIAWKAVIEALFETATTAGSIFLLLIGSHILSRLVAVTGLGTSFADWVMDANVSRVVFLCIIVVSFIVMGMFMDPLSIILLTVPLLMPIVDGYGISKLWFGVFVVILAELAIVTPPVGILSFIFHGMAKDVNVNSGHDISLSTIFKGIGMFMPGVLILLGLLIAFPAIATWLPGSM